MKAAKLVQTKLRQQLYRTTPSVRSASSFSSRRFIDLRSDTVTLPSPEMLQCSLHAALGDDVMGEDPTVQTLQDCVADRLGFEAGLFLPTGTMANLVALMAHCQYDRAAEVMVGAQPHISLWEGGNAAIVGGIHTRQLYENRDTAQISEREIRDAYRDDSDDHCAKTVLLCLENTHNMLGGVALPIKYMTHIGSLCRDLGMKLHIDGKETGGPMLENKKTVTCLMMYRYRSSIGKCSSGPRRIHGFAMRRRG